MDQNQTEQACCSHDAKGANGDNCRCPHHKMFPILLIMIGVVFLLKALGWISFGFVNIAWPILLIAIGLHKLCGGKCKCCGPEKK